MMQLNKTVYSAGMQYFSLTTGLNELSHKTSRSELQPKPAVNRSSGAMAWH